MSIGMMVVISNPSEVTVPVLEMVIGIECEITCEVMRIVVVIETAVIVMNNVGLEVRVFGVAEVARESRGACT